MASGANGQEFPVETGLTDEGDPALKILTSAGEFSTLKPDDITNLVICEVIQAAVSWKHVAEIMSRIYNTPHYKESVRSSFLRIKERKQKLRKKTRDASKIAAFNSAVYNPPQATGKRKIHTLSEIENGEIRPRQKKPKEDPYEQVAKELGAENANLRHLIIKQQAEIDKLKKDYDTSQKTLTSMRKKLTTQYTSIGLVNKRKYITQKFKRKNTQVAFWKKESKRWRRITIKLQKVNKKLTAENRCLQRTKRKSINVLKCKTKCRSEVDHQVTCTTALTTTLNTLKEKKQYINYLEDEICKSKEKQENSTIKTNFKGKIAPAMKEASMYLQSIGVAEKQVGPAIQAVVETLTNTTLDGPLPSISSQQRISGEMRSVCQQHLRQELKYAKDVTVKYDGTTKQGRHLVEVEIATQTNSYLVGSRETAGGTALEYVNCITEVLDEVDVELKSKLVNTMTDRCVTNNKVDRELEKQIGVKLNSFRCAMHPLDTIHKSCEKYVKTHECTLQINDREAMPFQSRGESKTQALLRATDKLFHDSASGLPKELPYFLRTLGFKGNENTTLYPRWVGNRFNIYFVNAGLLYAYDLHIQDFFSTVMKPRNSLHSAINNALRDGSLMPTLRALGLMDKYLTGPWMRWQGKANSILSTCDVFTSVLNSLDGLDGSDLIGGFEKTVFGTEVKKDKKYEVLIQSTPHNEETAMVFNGLVKEASAVMKRQLEDYLPNGKFHDPSQQLKAQAESCSSNNISGERVFAKIDSKQQRAKSALLQKSIDKAQFSLNRIQTEYLKGKNKEDKATILAKATKDARLDRLKDNKRQQLIRETIKARLAESRKIIQSRENNKREEKEKIIEDVLQMKLWETQDQITDALQSLSKTKAQASLKTQIRFRLDILGCIPVRKLKLSKVSLQELQEYLLELLQLEIHEDKQTISNIVKDHSILIGYEFNQKWTTDYHDSMCSGVINKIIQEPGKVAEYECTFGETTCFQTVSEILADMAVGDLFLFV